MLPSQSTNPYDPCSDAAFERTQRTSYRIFQGKEQLLGDSPLGVTNEIHDHFDLGCLREFLFDSR